jgi:hypothetical protein
MSYTTLENDSAPSLVVLDDTREIIVVSGSIGPKGDTGGTTLGDRPITITNLQGNDVLQFSLSQNAWINVPQSSITDGGTF